MKSNTFNYSLLAIGVAAVMGLSTVANAVTPTTGETTTGVDINNQATASYKVEGQDQPVAKSNIVKVTVSQQVSFTFSADNNDTAAPTNGTQFDDKNEEEEVAPNGFVVFRHTLTNTGNLTDNYTINLSSTDPKYDTTKSTVSYKIYNELNIEDTNRSQDNVPYATANKKSFPLEKGHYIKFTINAKTTDNKGNDSQTLQITAVSEELNKQGSVANIKQLINTNSSFTKLPTFSIVKTVLNGLDLKNLADTAKYQIVVTNDGTDFNTDATDIAIADVLPLGLVMAETLTTNNIQVTSGTNKGSIVGGVIDTNSFTVGGVDIPVGQSITITFEVKQGGSGTFDPENSINHVTVTDDLDDDTATDNTLIDSTNSSAENVEQFYPTNDTDFTNGTKPTIAGDDSTMPLVTIKRDLTLTGGTLKEIAPTTGLIASETAGQVTYSTVIKNTGKDTEGSKAGELTFTIKDDDGTKPDEINIVTGTVTITYYPNGDATTTPDPTVTNKQISDVGGIYDINSVLPTGVKAGGTVTIKYNVSANNAPMFTPIDSTDDAKATFEETFVTLIPGKEGAPNPVSVKDTTKVRGLTLVKKQAIAANCDSTTTGIIGSFVTTNIGGVSDPTQVLPGQCIVYQIEAKNTSTMGIGFDIKQVTISDEISTKADYVASSLTAINGVKDDTSTTTLKTTVATLAPQATATMQFKVKIKTAN